MPKRKPKSCDICGKKITVETWIHSKHTDMYYCKDVNKCGRGRR